MKLITSSCNIIKQEPLKEGLFKQIEIAGRTCYKSENNITDNSAVDFVKRIIKSKHGSVLEHGTLYYYLPLGVKDKSPDYDMDLQIIQFFLNNKYTKVNVKPVNSAFITGHYYITTNFRVITEQYNLDRKALHRCLYDNVPMKLHELRISVKFVCSRAIANELVRHRVFSFSQESSRYCNYSKDKFGNQVTYIIPNTLNLSEGEYSLTENKGILNVSGDKIEMSKFDKIEQVFLTSCLDSERNYMSYKNYSTDIARGALTLDTKTELIMTGFVSDWANFFELRANNKMGKPHPDMYYLANNLKEQFVQEKLL